MDFGSSSDVSIEMVGLAIESIPNLILSYSYNLLNNGTWGFGQNAILKVDVQPNGSFISAYSTGVSLNGRSMQPGRSRKEAECERIEHAHWSGLDTFPLAIETTEV